MTEPTTHNYGPGHRGWGHDYAIHETINGGRELHVSGWGPLVGPMIRQDDYLLIQNGNRDTRYRVTEIEHCLDPKDMWHATLTFAPRQSEPVKEQQ
ncbi:hypothetical protein KCMC57_64260 (plasmid) [Kitasatospora sp. CMC57]|uniref:Uncharacterized protein n=1 Tax=Kitasatospora sp. CMC57 TaxID=3231513 RepID=A0AB33KDX9_9ACTN